MTTHNVQIIKVKDSKEAHVTVRNHVRTPANIMSRVNGNGTHPIYNNIRLGSEFTMENPDYMQGVTKQQGDCLKEIVSRQLEAEGYTIVTKQRPHAKRPS